MNACIALMGQFGNTLHNIVDLIDIESNRPVLMGITFANQNARSSAQQIG